MALHYFGWVLCALSVATALGAQMPGMSPRNVQLLEWLSQKRVENKLPNSIVKLLPTRVWRDHGTVFALTLNQTSGASQGNNLLSVPLNWGLNEATVRNTPFGKAIEEPLAKLLESGELRSVDHLSLTAVLGLMHAAGSPSSPWHVLAQSLPVKFPDTPLTWGPKLFRDMARAGFPEINGEVSHIQEDLKHDWTILSKNSQLQQAFDVQPKLYFSEKYFTWAVVALWKYDLSVIADVPAPEAVQRQWKRNPRIAATIVSNGIWKLGELGLVPLVHQMNFCNWKNAAAAEESFSKALATKKSATFKPVAFQDLSQVETFLKDRSASYALHEVSADGEVKRTPTKDIQSPQPNARVTVDWTGGADANQVTYGTFVHDAVVNVIAERPLSVLEEACVPLPKPFSMTQLFAAHGFQFVTGPFYYEIEGNIDSEALQDVVSNVCDGCMDSVAVVDKKRELLAMAGLRGFNAHRLWGEAIRNTSAPITNLNVPVYQPEMVIAGGGYLPQELRELLTLDLHEKFKEGEKEGGQEGDDAVEEDEDEEEPSESQQFEEELRRITAGDIRWYFPRRGVRFPPGLASLFMVLRTMLLTEAQLEALYEDVEAKMHKLGGSLVRKQWDRLDLEWRQRMLQTTLVQHGGEQDRKVSRLAREWILDELRFPVGVNVDVIEAAGAKFQTAKGIEKDRVRLTQRRLRLYRALKGMLRQAEREGKWDDKRIPLGSNSISA